MPSYCEHLHQGNVFSKQTLSSLYTTCLCSVLFSITYCKAICQLCPLVTICNIAYIASSEIGKTYIVTFINISVMVVVNFLPQIFIYCQMSFVWNAMFVLTGLPVLAVFISWFVVHLPDNYQIASSVPLMSCLVTVVLLCNWQSTSPVPCHLFLNNFLRQMRKLRLGDVKCHLWGYVLFIVGILSGPACFLLPFI